MYVPAPELKAWAFASFINEDAALCNPDHRHLQQMEDEDGLVHGAKVEFLWAREKNERGDRQILGTAQLAAAGGGDPWSRGQRFQQLEEWFGCVPDFLITICAEYWEIAEDAQACALVEHELYHCAQKRDKFGCPKFDKDGRPVWAMRAHDVEEFVGVVQRYGASATYLESLRHAMETGPTIGQASLSKVCGACLGR